MFWDPFASNPKAADIEIQMATLTVEEFANLQRRRRSKHGQYPDLLQDFMSCGSNNRFWPKSQVLPACLSI